MDNKMKTRSGTILKRAVTILMAVALVMTMGFVPMGTSHGLEKATIPKAYKSGYNVYKCIDISNHQGVISVSSFKKLKSKHGITHVIVRVGYTGRNKLRIYGRWADASYKKNIENAYAAGLKVGAYYYSQAITVAQAKKEAKKTISLLAKYKSKITLPVAIDWEFNSSNRDLTRSAASKNGKAVNTKIISAYCDMIKDAGYKPMIYSSASIFTGYLNRDPLHANYKIWVASWTGGKATTYSKPMYMWQFTSDARFGASLTGTSRVDLNYVFIKKTGKWVAYSGGRYKYKQGSVYLKKQWLTLSGKKYYLDEDGYCLQNTYQKIGNYYYGFDKDGVMYKSTSATIGGKTYKFLSNGRSVLYQMKVVNIKDGKLNYRTKAGGGTVKGHYSVGDKILVVRVSGDWVQAKNGYWSISGEKGVSYLEVVKTWPQ